MTLAQQLRSNLREIICFGMVGIAATTVHYVIGLAAIERLQLSVYSANLIGYLCALCVSFFGHGLLTFRISLTKGIFLRFTIISVTTFLSSEILLIVLEEQLHLPHRLAMAVIVFFVPIVSYLFNKFWVYRSPTVQPSAGDD